MTTADFKKVLVKDDRIGNITDSIKYAVMKGGQSVTSQQFQAISSSASNVTFNIQVPSQETIIDRHLVWRATVQFQMTLVNNRVLANEVTPRDLLGYGDSASNSVPILAGNARMASSLAPFPLHQICTVMTATINNTSVSINIRDVLPFLLRFNDRRELAKYNSTAPTAFDTYFSYLDASGAVNNPLSSWSNSADNDLVQRGAFPVKFLDPSNNLAPLNMTTPIPGAGGTKDVVVEFTSAEPLLLSPWMFCDPAYNNQGMYGVQNLNFVFNCGALNRLWRTTLPVASAVATVPPNTVGVINIVPYRQLFTDCYLQFQFLTPHPSDLLPSRNICPYLNVPRYLSNVGNIGLGLSQTVVSQSLQLNQIPDKLVIAVRKQMSKQTNNDSDCFLPINNVSINFNNQAGILSGSTKWDLFDMSVKNGLNQSWSEWGGEAYVGSGSASSANNFVRTSGSVLVLEFGRDIQLPEDFYASGSLGNFNIQVQVNVKNNTNTDTNADYELVLITIESGVFVNERGSSQVYTGILTKQDVLEASSQEVYTRSDVQRLVGGGFFDTLKSIAGKVANVVAPVAQALGPVAKVALSQIPDPRAKLASQALGALGMGVTGGRKKDARLQ